MERQNRGFAAPAWHSEQRTKAFLVPALGEANLSHKFKTTMARWQSGKWTALPWRTSAA